MGMAILVGDAWQGLAAQVPGTRPIPESAVVLAGARALDEPERPRLEASAINHLPAASLADPATVVGAVAAMEPNPSGIYLHVDLDVLDSSVARVNRYAAADGISAAELEASVRALLADERVRAVALTAYEPDGRSGGPRAADRHGAARRGRRIARSGGIVPASRARPSG